MSETIQARVLRVIATTQRIPLEKVKPDSTFEELGIDSMDSINILFDLESEFDIEIKDEDAKKIRTIREMIDILGVAEGTVKARLARARAKLRQLMTKNGTRLEKDPRRKFRRVIPEVAGKQLPRAMNGTI